MKGYFFLIAGLLGSVYGNVIEVEKMTVSQEHRIQNSLIILPDARKNGIDTKNDPFLSLIHGAKKTILMASYKLKSNQLPQQDLLDALKAATQRGVKVHLIAENRLTGMEKSKTVEKTEQGDPQQAYQKIGVNIYSIWNKEKYDQSHTKFIVADSFAAIVGTTNFDKDQPSRDFAVRTNDPKIISELKQRFWSDVKPNLHSIKGTGRCLLWGPENQRERLNELIKRAKQSIHIYQQDLTDKGIINGLIDAAKRKVNVEVVMSPHPFGFDKPDNNTANQKLLSSAGGKVYLTKVRVHAKVMIVDHKMMYLGSTNFYQPAIDQNRNLGLLTQDSNLINQVLDIFETDKLKVDKARDSK